jgi:hypothetical protein
VIGERPAKHATKPKGEISLQTACKNSQAPVRTRPLVEPQASVVLSGYYRCLTMQASP